MTTGHSIDEVHDLLEQVDHAILDLKSEKLDSEIDAGNLPELCSVLLDLNGWFTSGYGSDLTHQLRIPASTLNKFLKLRGTIKVQTALSVADRVRSLLRSMDQASKANAPILTLVKTHQPKLQIPTLTIRAERWIIVAPSATNRQKIEAATLLIESIVMQLGGTNLPEEQQSLSPIERAQLIALLETALNLLRSPALEKGILKKLTQSLEDGVQKSVQKGTQEGLSVVMGQCARMLSELIKQLF